MVILGTLLLVATILGTAGIETFVMSVLGVFGTFIVQQIKKYAGIDGNKALTLAVVVSIALSVVGAFVSNAFTGADGTVSAVSILNGAFAVFTVSTLAYKYVVSQFSLTTPTV